MDIDIPRQRNVVLGLVAFLAREGLYQQYRAAVARGQFRVVRDLQRLWNNYQRRARRPIPDAQVDESEVTQDYPSAMPQIIAGVNNQWSWIYDKLKNGRQTCNDLKKENFVSYTGRWQSLTNFTVTPCAHLLSEDYNAATVQTDLPCYFFDLSSFPLAKHTKISGAGTVSVDQANLLPFYRMRCNKSLANNICPYTYTPLGGFKNEPGGVNDGGATFYWEDVNAPNADIVPYVEKYLHEWSDIRLIMAGAKTNPTKVHVKICQFTEPDFSPQRQYYDLAGSILQFDSSVDSQDSINEITGFWDKFWAYREVNPLRSVRNKANKPLYKVLYHKTFEYTPTTTIDADTNAEQRIFKLFFENGKVYSTNQGTSDKAQDDEVFGTGASEYGYKSYTRSSGFVANPDSCPFPDPEHGIWLMVYADTYAKFSGIPPVANPDKVPSFDIVVRSKFTIPQSSQA